MCNVKSALIPQPLLPLGEVEPIQILAPLLLGEGLGLRRERSVER